MHRHQSSDMLSQIRESVPTRSAPKILLIILLLSLYILYAIYSAMSVIDIPRKLYFYHAYDSGCNRVHSINHNDSHSSYISSLTEALKPENRHITLLITSCGRTDLLKRTIDSFTANLNSTQRKTYTIKNKIMIDDCCTGNKCGDILRNYNSDFTIIFTAKNSNLPREKKIMNALEVAHGQVQAPWIYHIEDDWQFFSNGTVDVIEESLRVFESQLNNLQDHNFMNPNNGWYNAHINQMKASTINICTAVWRVPIIMWYGIEIRC
eukprot:1147046_1